MTEFASKNPASAAASPPPGVSPLAVALDALPKLLGIPEELVDVHMKAGAPVGPDGTVNLIAYCAWLNREMNPPNNG